MHIIRKMMLLAALFAIASSTVASARERAAHVILIGLDGWGAYSVSAADMPNVASLMRGGACSLRKRSVLPSSSAPNWAAMFMGAPTEVHGYTKWGSKTPEIPSPVLNENGIFPTIFSVVRAAKPDADIAVMYEWSGIKHLVDTLSLSTHFHAAPTEAAPDNICSLAEDYIVEHKPALLAVCFDEPDHVGHAVGHDTPEYYATLTRLDTYVGRIVAAVEKAGIKDRTVIIVTGDHGGINKGHGGITLREMETPFVINGKSVKRGYEFSGVMLQQDVAATIAAIFGVKQPQAWNGRPVLDFFR